jgi:glycosyltransferase involved in cell wall biosynthesis
MTTAQSGIPAVSVVVPCYNGAPFLDQLQDTLEAQTFRDFETIIVDDGSNDEETLAKLAALDPSIRVIRQENQGVSAARNTGFRHARADLVLGLDCDDTISPDCLERKVALMRAAPADVALVTSYFRLCGDAHGQIVPRGFDAFTLLFSNTMPTCFLIRKDVWAAVGGYDETMRDGYEDWEFQLRVAHAGYRGLVIREPLIDYRISRRGMLFSLSSGKHAALYRYIRRKHAPLYSASAILSTWWRSRGESPAQISLLRALAMLAFSETTTDAFQTRVVVARRRRRIFGARVATLAVLYVFIDALVV